MDKVSKPTQLVLFFPCTEFGFEGWRWLAHANIKSKFYNIMLRPQQQVTLHWLTWHLTWHFITITNKPKHPHHHRWLNGWRVLVVLWTVGKILVIYAGMDQLDLMANKGPIVAEEAIYRSLSWVYKMTFFSFFSTGKKKLGRRLPQDECTQMERRLFRKPAREYKCDLIQWQLSC